jgi:hypothetical protein
MFDAGSTATTIDAEGDEPSGELPGSGSEVDDERARDDASALRHPRDRLGGVTGSELLIGERVNRFEAERFTHSGIVSAWRTMERVRGIEPPSQAWEAYVLPLNHTRVVPPDGPDGPQV